MRLVIVESPYAGKGRWALTRWWNRLQNIRYARAAVRDSLLRGESPIASHLLYTQPGILDDSIPKEREHGIGAGLAWRKVADASVVYCDRGISAGMRHGYKAAEEAGIPLEFRMIHV